MNEIIPYIITGIVSLAVGYALTYMSPRVRLVWWAQEFFYEIVVNPDQPKLFLYTHSISVQNTGRKTAEEVEIAHQWKPDYFKLDPQLDYDDDQSPDGTHIIRVASLGPREFVTVNCLSWKSTPKFLYARSKEGVANPITIQRQQVLSKPIQLLAVVTVLVGVGCLVYWFIKIFMFIVERVGI